MKVTIEVEEEQIKDYLAEKIAKRAFEEYGRRGKSILERVFYDVAKEILYDKETKEMLISRAVDKAAFEISRKGVARLLGNGFSAPKKTKKGGVK